MSEFVEITDIYLPGWGRTRGLLMRHGGRLWRIHMGDGAVDAQAVAAVMRGVLAEDG